MILKKLDQLGGLDKECYGVSYIDANTKERKPIFKKSIYDKENGTLYVKDKAAGGLNFDVNIDTYKNNGNVYVVNAIINKKPDNIFVELGRFHPENVELDPGKILILDKKETDGLNVVYENRIIHTGKTVCIDELFGIEIAETTQLSETEYTEKDYISIQLGSASLKKEEIAALHQGSYITLKQRAGNPAQIIHSGKVVATGEICIADDTFAIRVIEVK